MNLVGEVPVKGIEITWCDSQQNQKNYSVTKMKTTKFWGVALTVSALFFSACQEDATISEVEIPSPSTDITGDATYTNSVYDQSMETIALALVQSLKGSLKK